MNDPQPLADLSLAWMLSEAAEHGLAIKTRTYRRRLGVALGEPLPPPTAELTVSENKPLWWVVGAGWRHRKPKPDDPFHESVAQWRDSHPGYRN